MDVSAVSAAPATDAHAYGESAGTSDRSARASAAGTSKTFTVKNPAPLPAMPPKAPVDDSPRIKVEIKQRAGGSAHTTVVDTRPAFRCSSFRPSTSCK